MNWKDEDGKKWRIQRGATEVFIDSEIGGIWVCKLDGASEEPMLALYSQLATVSEELKAMTVVRDTLALENKALRVTARRQRIELGERSREDQPDPIAYLGAQQKEMRKRLNRLEANTSADEQMREDLDGQARDINTLDRHLKGTIDRLEETRARTEELEADCMERLRSLETWRSTDAADVAGRLADLERRLSDGWPGLMKGDTGDERQPP